MDPLNLNLKNISTKKPELVKKESHKYCVIPLEMENGPLRFKFPCRMKIFQHEKDFSLGITPSANLIEKFQEIEDRLNELAVEKRSEVHKLHPTFAKFQGDFHLLKEDKSENRKIYGKLYVDRLSKDSFSAPFNRAEVKDKTKRKIKNSVDLVGVPLDGIVVLDLKQIFCGNLKALTCVVKEVLIVEEIHPQSAFDEYEDV